MLQQLLVELEDADSRVFVSLFERGFVRPVHVSACIFALHPVSVLLVCAGQVLLELGLVRAPICLELRLG